MLNQDNDSNGVTTVATDSVEKHNGILSIVVLEIVTNLLCARGCIGL
jgi:hypothetical protein